MNKEILTPRRVRFILIIRTHLIIFSEFPIIIKGKLEPSIDKLGKSLTRKLMKFMNNMG